LPFPSADEGNEDKYTEYDQTYSADENDQPRWSIIATLTLLPSTFQKKNTTLIEHKTPNVVWCSCDTGLLRKLILHILCRVSFRHCMHKKCTS